MNKNLEKTSVSVAGTKAQQSKNGVVGSMKSNRNNDLKEGKDYLYLRKVSAHRLNNQIEKYVVLNMTSDQIAKQNVNPIAHEMAEFKDVDGHLIKEVFTFGKNGDRVHRDKFLDMIWHAIIGQNTENVNDKSDALQNIARLYPLYQSLKLDREGMDTVYPEEIWQASEYPLVSEYQELSDAEKKGLLEAAKEKEKSVVYPCQDEEMVTICGEKFPAKFLGEAIRTGCNGEASKPFKQSSDLYLYTLVFKVYLSYIIQGASQAVSVRNTVRYFMHMGKKISQGYVVDVLNCLYSQDMV